MSIFNVRTELHVAERLQRSLQRAQVALDTQVIKDSNFYAPEDSGHLQDSALLSSSVGEGLVMWNTPYARRLYYNPQYNFSKDKNPNAQGLWFEAAKTNHKKDWLKIVKQMMGGGNS